MLRTTHVKRIFLNNVYRWNRTQVRVTRGTGVMRPIVLSWPTQEPS